LFPLKNHMEKQNMFLSYWETCLLRENCFQSWINTETFKRFKYAAITIKVRLHTINRADLALNKRYFHVHLLPSHLLHLMQETWHALYWRNWKTFEDKVW
jgi:hypothetical protein